MSTSSERASAQIFQFPPRGRFAVANGERTGNSPAVAPNVVTVAFGSWYHDAAIQDDAQRRNH